MTKLGISVYPNKCDTVKLFSHIDLAYSYGYSEVYTTIQTPDAWFNNGLKDNYKDLIQHCARRKINLHVDINMSIIQRLHATPEDLSAFVKLGIKILRLDFGFEDHLYVARLTHNKEGILIEDNASMQDNPILRLKTIQTKGDINQYIAMHNFFPRPETGLSFDHTNYKSKLLSVSGIKVGAFINSLDSISVLFPLGKGLCTIESHRYKPAYISAGELYATNQYEYLFFGDIFPSENEMIQVSKIIYQHHVYIPVYFNESVSDELKNKLLNTVFVSRADQPENVVRAIQSRGCLPILPSNTVDMDKLSLTIDNQLSGRYEGELQITCKSLPAREYINVIGNVDRLAENLVELIKYAKIPFRLLEI